jgi:hypothetical protein
MKRDTDKLREERLKLVRRNLVNAYPEESAPMPAPKILGALRCRTGEIVELGAAREPRPVGRRVAKRDARETRPARANS